MCHSTSVRDVAFLPRQLSRPGHKLATSPGSITLTVGSASLAGCEASRLGMVEFLSDMQAAGGGLSEMMGAQELKVKVSSVWSLLERIGG